MRAKQRLSEEERSSEVNISPLIDVVFILLIFFVVTTIFVDESGLDFDTPSGCELRDGEGFSFDLTGTGELRFEGRTIELRDVSSLIARTGFVSPPGVRINVAINVPVYRTIALLDACEGSGAGSIILQALAE